eukprot:gb/GECG01012644.1/.p1 GENE.gb/GECG01012644.1/~~gb/GECG01012644.1/.p1  ORF type:complete len:261 (+),score=23.42 gb/GECG01012644.1/:1-783(+)
MEDGDAVQLLPAQWGMISTFTQADRTDPLTQLLLAEPDKRQITPRMLDRLRQLAEEKGAFPDPHYTYELDNRVLRSNHLQLISEFVDYVWDTNHTKNQVDMRMVISDDLFYSLMQYLETRCRAQQLLQDLTELHSGYSHWRNSKIVFRRTEGPTDACIGFHCDGDYASTTCQIALNSDSEYYGGELCFFMKDGLHFPRRPQGCMTKHTRTILHAVTALHRGVRKSLFLVDKSNGLGEGGVHHVQVSAVEGFLKRKMLSEL